MLRLINTSTASTFIFSIDKHMLQAVAVDFVPIEPYVSLATLLILSLYADRTIVSGLNLSWNR